MHSPRVNAEGGALSGLHVLLTSLYHCILPVGHVLRLETGDFTIVDLF